jgi:hypothetical protein
MFQKSQSSQLLRRVPARKVSDAIVLTAGSSKPAVVNSPMSWHSK